MKKFSTWMILSIGVIFWGLRIAAVYTETMGIDFLIKPLDTNTEIILLFTTLLAFILIAKRKILGVIIYIVSYWGYFGMDLYSKMMSTTSNVQDVMNVFVSFVGVLLPLFCLFDFILDKTRITNTQEKKTKWFYENKKYNREFDERADKNNYRTL